MSYEFFDISSPKEMLEKAKREYARMKSDLNTDNIFNFFVTAYHVMDHIKTVSGVDPKAIQGMYDDDFRMCQFACNKGKHAILKTITPYSSFADSVGGGETIYEVVDGSKRVRVEYLADKLINKWEKFFRENGI